MHTVVALVPKGNKFSYDPIVKKDTYAFLYFVPEKASPTKVKMIISLLEKDNTLIETHNFILEIDSTGKNYQEHHIGIVQDGMKQKLIFTAFDPETNAPLDTIWIGVELAKIKDGNDDKDDPDDSGIRIRPVRPKSPSATYQLQE